LGLASERGSGQATTSGRILFCDNALVTDEPAASRPLDYRMSFAAERTYLAYLRTALALLAGGVAVVGAFPHAGHADVRRVMGVVLVVSGLLTAVGARSRWKQLEMVMRRGGPLPRSLVGDVAVVAVVLAGLLGLVFIALV
jgi:putative membrane protein